ncbi:MAG: hypothetical protein NVSMB27_40330 [Ktedonobacteraceae bacterium]
MQLPRSVEVIEVGSRDGLQNEAITIPTEGKLALFLGFTHLIRN